MFFSTPLFGDRFQIPIPLYGLILLAIGGFFFYVSSQKRRDRKPRNFSETIISKPQIGFRMTLAVLGLYLTVMFGGFVSTLLLSRHYTVETFGKISASGHAFSLVWTCFLVLSLVLYMWLVYRKKNDKTVRHGF